MTRPTNGGAYAAELARKLSLIHGRWMPHAGQVVAGKQIFYRGKKFVFLQCGRNFGKSRFIGYCAIRVAAALPKRLCYIVLPERKQAQEVMWSSGLLEAVIPKEFLYPKREDSWNKSELRITLRNGSFIKLEGADNPDALRGIKPHFVAYDEFRDFKTDVYDIMEPNLGANDATLLICSTPPDREGLYTELRKLFMEKTEKGNSDYFYMELPTETNPHYPKNRLEATKATLIKRGEYSKWLREYMAQFIPGGANAVFPMFADRKDKIVRPSGVLKNLIEPDRKKLEWYAVFDPASNSTFAVLFAAVNKHTGQIFIIDELYERDRMRTGPLSMWGRAQEIKMKWFPYLDRWTNIYDEQASWFVTDLERHHALANNESIEPTHKRSRDKDEDMSMIKDLFLSENRILIGENCTNLVWEISNYTTGEDGGYLKRDDHLIDAVRYLIAGSSYEPNEYPDIDMIPEGHERLKRALDVDSWWKEKRRGEDLAYGIDEEEVIYLDDLNFGGAF